MNCLFCKIVNKEIPSHKVFEDKNFYAFLDISPLNQGHTLLIPKNHFKNLLEADDKTVALANDVIKKIDMVFKDKLKNEGLTVITNNNLGQEIKHLHWHLIPRYQDENYKLVQPVKMNVDELHKKLA